MPRPQTPGRVDRSRLRTFAAAFTSLTAVIATSLVAGPATAVSAAGPCALARTDDHHSEGVDTWNSAYPRPLHRLHAVMVFLSFPDSKPQVAPDDLAADYFPDTSRFFARASYGRFRLDTDPVRAWVRMPETSTSYGIQRDWDPKRRSDYLRDAIGAADRRVNFARYDVVYLVADPDAPGVDSDATKVVNFEQPLRADGTQLRRVVTVFEEHPPDRNVLAHETGHVFDLPDLYHRPRDGKSDWDTYVGDWDLMGSQFGLAPEPLGWHKWKLGWLNRGQVGCVEKSGTSVHSLDALAAPPRRGSDGGTRLLVIRTGAATAIAAEVREAHGNDSETCTEGVLVYRVRSGVASGGGPVEILDGHPRSAACPAASVFPPLADAPLGVGERLTDRDSGVAVEVLGTDEGGRWTVRATLP
ncbi:MULTISPECIES: M6 family metalloprotease domain-containing protein [unclassified Streptomyces]|uniref:M6 family metalloprotease domain-containing protein n=1 Tax=unclassified Streptomyces TaxID=2593676 RepID=UPI003FCFBB9F